MSALSSPPLLLRPINDNDSMWYFTAEQLANSPSRQNGISADQELSYRQMTAYLIQEMGQRLQVSQLCINTAIVYMHRFYAFHSFTHFHRNGIAAASLFLAAKVEEQPRKLEHIIKAANKCLNQPPSATTDAYYIEQAQDLVFNENVLLQTLGFDVAIDHPHTHVVRTCQLVKACKDLAQTSYFLASNSLHLTSMCLQYKPTIVACFCIYLACKWSRWEIPQSTEGKHWFHYVDESVTMDLLKQLTDEFIVIYEKSPARLKSKLNSIKALAQGAGRNQSQAKDKGDQDWKISDMMKMYHTADGAVSANSQPQSVQFLTQTTINDPPQMTQPSATSMPPPSHQAQARKTETHTAGVHRSSHSIPSTAPHHSGKVNYPAADLTDHKMNSHKPHQFVNNMSSRSREHSSSVSSGHQQQAQMLSTKVSGAGRSTTNPSNLPPGPNQLRQTTQNHLLDVNYHKQRDRSLPSGHSLPPYGIAHKVNHKVDAGQSQRSLTQKDAGGRLPPEYPTKSSNHTSSISSGKSLSAISSSANQYVGNNSHISSVANSNPQMCPKVDGPHDMTRNMMHNARHGNNPPNANGPPTQSLPTIGYHQQQQQQQQQHISRHNNHINNVLKHEQSKQTSVHMQQQLHQQQQQQHLQHQQHQQQQQQLQQLQMQQQQQQQQPLNIHHNHNKQMPAAEAAASSSSASASSSSSSLSFPNSSVSHEHHHHGHHHGPIQSNSYSNMRSIDHSQHSEEHSSTQYHLNSSGANHLPMQTNTKVPNSLFSPEWNEKTPMQQQQHQQQLMQHQQQQQQHIQQMHQQQMQQLQAFQKYAAFGTNLNGSIINNNNTNTNANTNPNPNMNNASETYGYKMPPTTVSNGLKRDKNRNVNNAAEAALLGNRLATSSQQQQQTVKSSLPKKFENLQQIHNENNPTQTGGNNGIVGVGVGVGVKRLNDYSSVKLEEDATRENKIRKIDRVADLNKHQIVNGIETNPDLVRNLLKESLCTTSGLLKADSLTMTSQPPAELLQPSATDACLPNELSSSHTLENPTAASKNLQMESNDQQQQALAAANAGGGGGGKSEKKKKKDKHKHKEKDKLKDREERKKHKKDKDRQKNKDRDRQQSENTEPVKIKISKEKLESSNNNNNLLNNNEPIGLKIKIPKEIIAGDLHATSNLMSHHANLTANATVSHAANPLKIKISKDKLDNYNSGGGGGGGHIAANNAITTASNPYGQNQRSSSAAAAASVTTATSVPSSYGGGSHVNAVAFNMAVAGATAGGTAAGTAGRKRDRDRDKEKKRLYDHSVKTNGRGASNNHHSIKGIYNNNKLANDNDMMDLIYHKNNSNIIKNTGTVTDAVPKVNVNTNPGVIGVRMKVS